MWSVVAAGDFRSGVGIERGGLEVRLGQFGEASLRVTRPRSAARASRDHGRRRRAESSLRGVLMRHGPGRT